MVSIIPWLQNFPANMLFLKRLSGFIALRGWEVGLPQGQLSNPNPVPVQGWAGRDVQAGAGSGCILPAPPGWGNCRAWGSCAWGRVGTPSCPVTPPHHPQEGLSQLPCPQDIPSALTTTLQRMELGLWMCPSCCCCCLDCLSCLG